MSSSGYYIRRGEATTLDQKAMLETIFFPPEPIFVHSFIHSFTQYLFDTVPELETEMVAAFTELIFSGSQLTNCV